MKHNFSFDIHKYVAPNSWRSLSEIILSLILLILGITTLYFAIQDTLWLLYIVSIIPVALLFTRLFVLQHDLGHGNLFKQKKYNNIAGVLIGIAMLTPYYFWRKTHTLHHVRGGNADKRPWVGDIDLLTVSEFKTKSNKEKFLYKLYRNPLVMFFLGSIYVFMIDQRFCRKKNGFGKKEWWSVMGTNIGIIMLYGPLIVWLGIKFYLLGILLPEWLGGVVGIYLFYAQHNFKNRYYVGDKEWNLKDSALKGSTFYHLPQPLRWLTANIGYHHVHTFVPRIPFYKLKQCHEENIFFHVAPQYGLKDIPKLISLKLYDEESNTMITWKEYKTICSSE